MPTLNKVIDPLIRKAKAENGGLAITFADVFSGTGFVSNYYKDHESIRRVVSSDLELYSYVLNKALLGTVCSNKLLRIIAFFNGPKLKPVKGLIWRHFSLAGGRMFFTEDNAMRIDAIRIAISRLYKVGKITYKEVLFLLGSLMCACSRSANAASCFRAYLKQFCPRSLKRLEVHPIHRSMTRPMKHHKMVKGDACMMTKRYAIDVAYLDPPYNANHYGSYYSFYNYLMVYDKNYEIGGVAGVTKEYNKSNFGFKATAKQTLCQLVDNLKDSKYIIMSYNNDGVLNKNEVIECFQRVGSVTLHKAINKKFKPNDRVKNIHVIEYLFVVKVGTAPSTRAEVIEKWLA